MIVEYFRPKSMDEALTLLKRKQPRTIPLGGGTTISKSQGEPVAVVDLQSLGLDTISKENGNFILGSTVTLSSMETFINLPAFSEAVQIQASKNLRNSGTIAGLICSANGRSPLLTLLLALDCHLIWEPEGREISLGNWLPVRKDWKDGLLISKVILPDTKFRFGSVGRSPKDQPIICCAIAKWANNRMRVAVGGFGKIPTLVLDGNTSDEIEIAVASALKDASDQWASAEYRIEAGMKLAKRLMNELIAEG
jgi:CO/xanthine dehydrogenase FAD-binding subunit